MFDTFGHEGRLAMLVLTRRLMEKLYIGDEICITVVRLEGGQVRLGIDAPREVRVVRAEIKGRPAEVTAPDPPPRACGSQPREPSR